jgi:hypothetical protein
MAALPATERAPYTLKNGGAKERPVTPPPTLAITPSTTAGGRRNHQGRRPEQQHPTPLRDRGLPPP